MSMIGKYPKEKVSKLAYNSCMGFFDDIKKKMKPSTGLAPVMAPGGPCVPGQRRLFVSVDGALYPCERISETSDIMRIGDIYNGIDHTKVDALLNFFTSHSLLMKPTALPSMRMLFSSSPVNTKGS